MTSHAPRTPGNLVRCAPRRHEQPSGAWRLGIAIAIALGAVAVVESRTVHDCSSSKAMVADRFVHQLAADSYARWRADHAPRRCPDTLAALDDDANMRTDRDPWGRPYRWRCTAALGLLVWSTGEDGVDGTTDDAYAWGR